MGFISTDTVQSKICAIDRMNNGLNAVFCLRLTTPSHYHHHTELHRGVEHMRRKIEESVNAVVKYGVVGVQLTYSSFADWEDVFVTHVIITIKSDVLMFLIAVLYSVIVCLGWLYIFCQLFHIDLGKNVFGVSITTVQFMMCTNN